MKKIYLHIMLVIIISNLYSQSQNCNKCETKDIQQIKVTYEYTAIKTDFPRPFVYKIKTYMIINDTMSQFVYNRKTKVVREGNYQTKIGSHKYINNYYFKSGLMEETRDLEDIKIKAKWKPNYKWKITDDTKTIKGYKVRKAIANSIEMASDDPAYYGKVIAWFTEEIPIPAGPNRYVGLPGLIIEIKYENSNVNAIISSIEYNTKENIKDMSEAVLVQDPDDVIYYYHKNKKLMHELKKKYKKSFFSIFK